MLNYTSVGEDEFEQILFVGPKILCQNPGLGSIQNTHAVVVDEGAQSSSASSGDLTSLVCISELLT